MTPLRAYDSWKILLSTATALVHWLTTYTIVENLYLSCYSTCIRSNSNHLLFSPVKLARWKLEARIDSHCTEDIDGVSIDWCSKVRNVTLELRLTPFALCWTPELNGWHAPPRQSGHCVELRTTGDLGMT